MAEVPERISVSLVTSDSGVTATHPLPPRPVYEYISLSAHQKALADEREACAVIADRDDHTHPSGYRCTRGSHIASTIRNRPSGESNG